MLHDGAWFTGPFALIADQFAQCRNEGAHTRKVDREEVVRWRDQMLGVGCEGVVGQLAGVRTRDGR